MLEQPMTSLLRRHFRWQEMLEDGVPMCVCMGPHACICVRDTRICVVPLWFACFHLSAFGGATQKPLHVWCTNPKVLQHIHPERVRPVRVCGKKLGTRWWNAIAAKWKFNGDKRAMGESSAYTAEFGRAVVQCF